MGVVDWIDLAKNKNKWRGACEHGDQWREPVNMVTSDGEPVNTVISDGSLWTWWPSDGEPVNTVTNLPVPQNAGNCLSSWGTVTKKALLSGVGKLIS